MIKSFKEFEGATFFELEECEADIEALQEESKTLDISNVQEMIKEYFSLNVEERIIRKIIYQDLDLALEVYSDAVRDTCVRDMFIDAILKEVGLPNWPINSDPAGHKIEFYRRLTEICNKENSGISK